MARTLTGGDNMTNGAAVKTGVAFTMACWFKPATLTAVQALMTLDNNAVTNQHALSTGATGTCRAGSTISGTANAITIATASVGVWAHFAGVWATVTSRSAYLNGANKVTEATSKTPTGIIRTRLGVLQNATAPADGDMAEAAIWGVALSDAEVALIATGISPYEVQRANLLAYWPLLGLNDPETDKVGAFPLTLTGSPAGAAHPAGIFYGKTRFSRRGMLAA